MSTTRTEHKDLAVIADEYLGNGGFFNPELMEHDKVRDLILAMRDALVGCVRPQAAWIQQRLQGPNASALGTTGEKASINAGELAKAKRRAMRIFDDWQQVTGALDGTSWLWELEGIIEDAVEIGVQAAYGIRKPLDSEEPDAPPLAPSSKDRCIVAGPWATDECSRGTSGCGIKHVPPSAPREPQPSSECPDCEGEGFDTTGYEVCPTCKPSSEASATQMEETFPQPSSEPEGCIRCEGEQFDGFICEGCGRRLVCWQDGSFSWLPPEADDEDDEIAPSSEASAPQTEEIKEQPMADDIPRRIRIDQQTPAEAAIRAAVNAVEALPADVRLTDAVVLLQAAKDSVADYIDGIDSRRSVSESAHAAAPREPQPSSDASAPQTGPAPDLGPAVERLWHDIYAYRGALGYDVPGWHDGRLSDGTTPRCGLCNARDPREPHAALVKDATRYRTLRRLLTNAVGGGVEVNDAKLVYETPEAGEVVRLYWYPDTPVGFCEVKADTLDDALDAALGKGDQT